MRCSGHFEVVDAATNAGAVTDIYLEGHILNPGGETRIANLGASGSDILARGTSNAGSQFFEPGTTAKDSWINTREVSLHAENGRIGESARLRPPRLSAAGAAAELPGREQGRHRDGGRLHRGPVVCAAVRRA